MLRDVDVRHDQVVIVIKTNRGAWPPFMFRKLNLNLSTKCERNISTKYSQRLLLNLTVYIYRC